MRILLELSGAFIVALDRRHAFFWCIHSLLNLNKQIPAWCLFYDHTKLNNLAKSQFAFNLKRQGAFF